MFFAGGFVYLIKNKLVFSYKLFALALIYCAVCMAFFSSNSAGIYIAIPMTYILLVLSIKINLRSSLRKMTYPMEHISMHGQYSV